MPAPSKPLPLPTPSVPPLPPQPPKSKPIVPPRRPSPFKKIFLVVIFLLILVLVVFVFLLTRLGRPASTPSPQPEAETPSPTPAVEAFPTSVTPTGPGGYTSRLPITALAGRQLLTVSGSRIWLIDFTREGPRKSLFVDNELPVRDISLSPNKQLLAVFFTGSGSTGLRVYDLRDRSLTEYINPTSQNIGSPAWPADSLYLAVWHPGRSVSLFDATTKRRQLDIPASSGNIGPIVFVPNEPKISYIDGHTLYEVDYSGQQRTTILEGANPVSDTGQPDIHSYSPDGRFITYHNVLKQLIVFNKDDKTLQILAEGDSRPFGQAVATNNTSTAMVYWDYRGPDYRPGEDDHPLYIYRLLDKSGNPFFVNRKTTILPASIIPDPGLQRLLMHHQGFAVFDFDGNMYANCDYTGFSYRYPAPPLSVWSPDSEFILSVSTAQIAQISTCAVSGAFDSEPIDHAVWVK